MKQSDPDEFTYPRFASTGRTYVYVLPCRGEDLLKVGFTRDPLQRFRTLHRRFYAFFDLEAALLMETERLREARLIMQSATLSKARHQGARRMGRLNTLAPNMYDRRP